MIYKTTDTTISFVPKNKADAFKLGGIFRGSDLPCKMHFASGELLFIEIETKDILDMIKDNSNE
jgi:hypothetical protein